MKKIIKQIIIFYKWLKLIWIICHDYRFSFKEWSDEYELIKGLRKLYDEADNYNLLPEHKCILGWSATRLAILNNNNLSLLKEVNGIKTNRK